MAAIGFAPPAAPPDFAHLFSVTSSYLVGISEDWQR
jgi:hypothetical protein